MENKTNNNEKNEINELNKKIAQLEERIEQLETENDRFEENVKEIVVNLFSFTSHLQQEFVHDTL